MFRSVASRTYAKSKMKTHKACKPQTIGPFMNLRAVVLFVSSYNSLHTLPMNYIFVLV